MDYLPDENRRFRELERMYWADSPQRAIPGPGRDRTGPVALRSPFCAGLVLSATTPVGTALVTVFVGAAVGLLVAVVGAATAATSLLLAVHR